MILLTIRKVNDMYVVDYLRETHPLFQEYRMLLEKHHGMDVTILMSKPCFHCGDSGLVVVTNSDLERYKNGALMQEAFPEMSIENREMLISGTHEACWNKIYGGDE